MTATEREVVAHLIARGLVAAGADVEIAPLTGGISSDVFGVRVPDGPDLVVKRALSKLRVEADWFADPARIDTEGRALRLAGSILPAAVPVVVDLSDGWLVMTRAPRTWTVWKDDLLAGDADTRVAARLGSALGTWQAATADDPPAEFADREAFRQLRVEPFLLTVAARNPDVADAVRETVAVMAATTACLVHGDFTPKNMLVGPLGVGTLGVGTLGAGTLGVGPPAAGGAPGGGGPPVWVLDWEIAHVGDPTFDLGSMLGHLLVKSVHRPSSAAAYKECAVAFLDACAAVTSVPLPADQVVRQSACMALARVDGKSPLGYLSDASRRRLRTLARDLLLDAPATVTDAWSRLP